MNNIKENKYNVGNKILDIITAILLSFKIINYSLVCITKSSEEGYLNLLFLVIGVAFLIIYFFKYIKKQSNILKITYLGIFLIIIVFFLYIVNYNKTNISIFEILIYFVFAFIIGYRKDKNIERILVYVMSVSLIPLFCFNQLFEIKWYGSVTMDISYAFLPTIIAALVHFSYYYSKRKNKASCLILYFINIFYFSQILLYGERGTIVCILVALLFCWNIRYKNEKLLKKNLGIKFFLLIIFGILFILFYKEALKTFVEMTNIESYSINKFISLSGNDVSNGRFDLYSIAIDGFLNSPLIGIHITYYFNYFLMVEFYYLSYLCIYS